MSELVVQPSGPRGHFLSGHLSHFRNDSLEFLTRCAREYGHIVRLNFGQIPVFVLNDPAHIEEVLVHQNRRFIKSEGVRAFRVVLGDGLFTSEGEFWRRQRRLMQPAFHQERLHAYGETMVDSTRQMVDGWTDGEVRDIHAEMMRLTLDIAARTLFSAEVAGTAAAVAESLNFILDYINRRLSGLLLFMTPLWVPIPDHIRLRREIGRLDKIVYQIIEERRRTRTDNGDLLSMLLHAVDEDGSTMTDRQLRDEVMTLFLAGHETTAVLMTWTWYLLAQHPEVAAKLRAELASVLAGRTPTADDYARLPYTQQIIQESLRLYPPVWIFGREPLEDVQIGGCRIPRGAVVLFSPWVVHRDERHFANPERFDPDRWAGGLAKRLPRYAFFPFGGGPRLCIGYQFALMEAVLILATVAQAFRLELAPDQKVELQPLATIRPRHGLKMRLSENR